MEEPVDMYLTYRTPELTLAAELGGVGPPGEGETVIRNRWPALAVVILVALSLVSVAACGSDDDDDGSGATASESTEKQGDDIAIATSVSLKSGYGKAVTDGADRIEQELGNKVDIAEQVAPAEFGSLLQDFATRGYKLVIVDGADWQEATLKVASRFEDTTFVVVNGFQPQKPNVAAIDFAFEQSGFLAGVVAGLATESNQVGGVGGVQLPPIARLFYGYEQGVKHVNPKAKTTISFTGSFTDTGKAASVTEAQLSKGVDLVWAIAANANAGIYKAAKDRGALAIGYGVDDRANAPGNLITTATVDYAKVFYDTAQAYNDGKLKPTLQTLGFDQGVLGLGPFGAGVDQAVIDKAKALEKQAKADKIEIEQMPPDG